MAVVDLPGALPPETLAWSPGPLRDKWGERDLSRDGAHQDAAPRGARSRRAHAQRVAVPE